MSSPIKPPGGPPRPPSLDDAAGPQGARGPSGKSEAFSEALDPAGRAEGAQQSAAVEPGESVAADLRAGRIDVETAIERLLQQALESPAAAALTPAGKAELEAHLRRALAEDPALLAMTKDLERNG